jgi:hypothetical protein
VLGKVGSTKMYVIFMVLKDRITLIRKILIMDGGICV